MAVAEQIEKKPLTQMAYDTISQWLVDGTLQPDDALIEKDLAARLQIHR